QGRLQLATGGHQPARWIHTCVLLGNRQPADIEGDCAGHEEQSMKSLLIGVMILASALMACARQHEPQKDRAQTSSESASTSARPTIAASAASLSPAIADLLVSLRSTNWRARADAY